MNKIEKHYWKAYDLAIEKLKKMALKKLNQDHTIEEFVMGMGTYFFTDINGEEVDSSRYEKLDLFIMQWDSNLLLTGETMRFKRDGVIITDW